MALPFLGVRIAYGIMAAWSSSSIFGTPLSSDPVLSKMNPAAGDWSFYLVLGKLMEFLTAVMFMIASTIMAQRRH